MQDYFQETAIYRTTYWCNVWANCSLNMLYKLQKRACRGVSSTVGGSLEPLAYRRKVAGLSMFYRCCFGRIVTCILIDDMTFATISRCLKDASANSFFAKTSSEFPFTPRVHDVGIYIT